MKKQFNAGINVDNFINRDVKDSWILLRGLQLQFGERSHSH